MFEKRGFDFQRRKFVAAALDDIDGQSTHDPVVAVFTVRDVAGSEPTVIERCGRHLGTIPILAKDGWTTTLDFARLAIGRYQLSLLRLESELNAWQGLAHGSGQPCSVVGIGKGHADFRHAVSF